MKHIQGRVKGFRGCHLYYQSWLPTQPSQAIIVLVHGIGGHSGVFQNVVEYLVPQGYEVYALICEGMDDRPDSEDISTSGENFEKTCIPSCSIFGCSAPAAR